MEKIKNIFKKIKSFFVNFKEIYNIILNIKDIDKTTKDYFIKILTILGNELISPKKEK